MVHIMSTGNDLPAEIVYQILSFQFMDLMSNDHPGNSEKFNENLRTFIRSNLTVNRTFHHICRVLIYRYCNLTTAKRFHSLLGTLRNNKQLRNIVQIADFQELTSIGLGRTGEMNKMIKNLTNETVLEFLTLTQSTLREFLACEHIQDDLDENVIHFLLRPGTVLSVLDFCGCSGQKFTDSFVEALAKLYRFDKDRNKSVAREENFQISCLGLNDCTDLPPSVLTGILQMLPELQKLDLGHTSVDDDTLMNGVPHLKNLTHLSLAMCFKLSPRGLLEFFSHHPAVTDENNSETLKWLNLSCTLHSSAFTEVHTMFLLKKLCQYGHNKTLQYLNIGGMPLHESHERTAVRSTHYYLYHDSLHFIKNNFPELKSLSIRGNNVTIPTLCEFLSPSLAPPDEQEADVDNDEDRKVQQLKFLNISSNANVNKWTIQDPSLFTCSPSLVALEISFDAWQQIEKGNEKHEINALCYKNPNALIKDTTDAKSVKWKCYIDSTYGRRYWIHKVDDFLNRGDLDTTGSLVNYDSEGHKIIKIVKQPDFLKFAQTKIMLGCGIVPFSGIRRKECYRDLKPPISQFFTRNGGVTCGNTATPILTPRLPPGGWRLIHHDDGNNNNTGDAILEQDEDHVSEGHQEQEGDEFDDSTSSVSSNRILSPSSRLGSRGGFRDGLYWDRSMQNLNTLSDNVQLRNLAEEQMLSTQPQDLIENLEEQVEENDDEYLFDVALQRRRSQLNLFRHDMSHRSLDQRRFERDSSTSVLYPAKRPKNYFQEKPEEFFYDPKYPQTTLKYRIHFQIVNEYEVFGCVERGMYRYYSLKM
ncbi:hypothetical protein HG535_0A08680 [Zygotorulaspora mrakii]|uniref:Uncharacterized protein n=1 Tax=Zygotorulaspora mrakii TaxID=42260 RepID=A0A7H9AXB3_ZYGMR|nr:uncharacterized protein HG535_0A08680 [Zygotorulaspora mrakii]QLG70921.1 hypothetical protein HG535_0A08680 [Zygotorulaspora mrakii]